MSNTIGLATSAVDINMVGQSWTQENASAYVWTQMPTASTLDARSGRTGVTTYEIPNLDNFMLKTNGLMNWDPGVSEPPSRTLGSTTVTLTTYGRANPFTVDRPANRGPGHRFADLEGNIVPGLLGELYQGLEQLVLANIFSTSFGSSKTWTGTNALDTYASDHIPAKDIQVALQPLRKYQSRSGHQLEAVIDHRVLLTLAGYETYTGAGTGSNNASFIAEEELVRRFQAAHGIDRVHIARGARDSVDLGQTSSLTDLGAGGLAIGVFDRRMSRFDLRDQESTDAPDGVFVLGFGTDPYVHNWVNEATETEYFHARCSFGIANPRGNSWGIFYPASENIT